MKQKPQIILNAIGGLGNRIKTILAARQLSSLTQRELKVVWHTDSGCNAAVEELFDTSAFDFETISPDNFEYMLKYEIPARKTYIFQPYIKEACFVFAMGKNGCLKSWLAKVSGKLKNLIRTYLSLPGLCFFHFRQKAVEQYSGPHKM